MKQRRDVLWVVEIKGESGEYVPLVVKVRHSRLEAKLLKKVTEAGYPAGTKFRVAKYVREGGGQ